MNQNGSAIRKFRLQRGFTQKEVADRLGFNRSTITLWETGKTEPSHDSLLRLAELFGTTVDALMGGSGQAQCYTFPIIGEVAAGYGGGEAREIYTGEKLEVPTAWLNGLQPDEFFVLRASGDSMYPEILDKDLLLVRRTEEVPSGKIAIVLLRDGSGTVKRIEYLPGRSSLTLRPRNPEYKDRTISGPELNELRIQGQVRKIIRDV